jgi:excisionase family DNA binding protein
MLLTASQVAELLGVSLRTVQHRAQLGQLPYVQKLPGKTGAFLFDSDDIIGCEPQDAA